ncbi:alanine/glycine:cation symporter family protein [Alkalitalea saponilacus]|uniref:Alanine or glycine:cation symporter, AGCS family n=1 Tax=Alkalitalea saponilacus TaxID=889453 RepID=A0A1T5HKX9_9BACT|nr:sodium:alanine symporter family protein [Alkalitalea saponilacus]ASB47795.1 amino acid carrier protein [Alkalitalea saponilacus]SKC21296.1 alanine or glycine:cation symporter, AGCS family [Alkalitalea saponilacus]
MQKLNDFLSILDSYIGGGQWFVFLLLGTGLFFTIYLVFPQIRFFKYAIKMVKGKFDREGDEGDTSHFQALTTALSGTVGTGNIAGVALAVHLGGPAALFWMLVTALIGMTTKFVEVTLSHKHREKAEDGTIAGGPMYYMKKRLNIKLPSGKWLNFGKWMAIIFAVATVFSSFGTGSLPQINSISNSLWETFSIPHMLTGAVLAVLLAFVIVGGIKRIAKVTQTLVPVMAIIYFLGAFLVIIYNYENIWPSMVAIFADLFTGSSATGGFLGASVAFAFNRGVNRGLFSNEAGQGSAPIAHAAARAHEPVSEGMVALLEPFIDTIIICMLTGMTLLASGVWQEKHENLFQMADLAVVEGLYDDGIESDRQSLGAHVNGKKSLPLFTGNLKVTEGQITDEISIIHARSLAENVFLIQGNMPWTGEVPVVRGRMSPPEGVRVFGESLIHSAPLTTIAFSRSWLGEYGKYIVSIGLLLFAFSTAISWSYYGERAMIYLFGMNSVIWYKLVYVVGFFVASFVDTSIVWVFSGITIALMTIPNLIGILILHREVKSEVKSFWKEYAERFPDEKAPKY